MKTKSERYSLLDAARGFALLNMLVFHFVYDILIIYGVYPKWNHSLSFLIWERFICVSFIVISGVSVNFSKNAYKRGIIVNLLGFLVTAVTVIFMPSQAIWFGVLNLIGCGMLVCRAMKTTFDRINPIAGAVTSLALYAVAYGVPEGYLGLFSLKILSLPEWLYGFKYAAFLGFPSSDFRSADYFPLIPWLFLFILGYFLWKIIEKLGKQDWFRLKIPALDFMGRYSLWFYVAHQPLLMGICILIFRVFP